MERGNAPTPCTAVVKVIVEAGNRHGTATLTFRFFLGEGTGWNLGGVRGVRESEKMVKKRDYMSLQAKNALAQDLSGGFSWLPQLRTGDTNRALRKLFHLLHLEGLLPARGPGLGDGRARSPGGFCTSAWGTCHRDCSPDLDGSPHLDGSPDLDGSSLANLEQHT